MTEDLLLVSRSFPAAHLGQRYVKAAVIQREDPAHLPPRFLPDESDVDPPRDLPPVRHLPVGYVDSHPRGDGLPPRLGDRRVVEACDREGLAGGEDEAAHLHVEVDVERVESVAVVGHEPFEPRRETAVVDGGDAVALEELARLQYLLRAVEAAEVMDSLEPLVQVRVLLDPPLAVVVLLPDAGLVPHDLALGVAHPRPHPEERLVVAGVEPVARLAYERDHRVVLDVHAVLQVVVLHPHVLAGQEVLHRVTGARARALGYVPVYDPVLGADRHEALLPAAGRPDVGPVPGRVDVAVTERRGHVEAERAGAVPEPGGARGERTLPP
ncbi:hypothetical protein THAOC_20716 [Thalassiosira oceanica]|uniref:Uncharacterized protein n=1 Tax=Thalassiosira oceanica TaxID=159749 RepID=K0RZ77_THAOC|nr:hypothetical protein THAOC_20716 [Thalassiosira oceanica]|eukprot:EJK59103.1 hypothetical protein THAOC_20716 [Thalassiosira oceanica]